MEKDFRKVKGWNPTFDGMSEEDDFKYSDYVKTDDYEALLIKYEQRGKRIKELEKERLFRDHIQAHLNEQGIPGEVICKICGKTAKEITGVI